MLLKYKLLLEIIDQLPIAVFAKDPNDNYKFVIWNKKMSLLFSLPQKKSMVLLILISLVTLRRQGILER